MTGRVLVVGSASVDIMLSVDRLPSPGATVLTRSSSQGFGGKGANQAVAARAAGAEVAMVGRFGDDPAGAAYRSRLAGLGIDVSGVLLTPGSRTGTAYITVDSAGENSIVVDPGANARLTEDDVAPVGDLGPGDVLLVQCELPLDVVGFAVRRAAEAGARVVLNLAPFAALPASVLRRADPLVLNEEEAGLHRQRLELGPDGSEELTGPGSMLVTLGSAGARWGDLELSAVRVEPRDVIDTTGAGDAFCGALAAGLARGADRRAAMRAALQAGADAVRRLGAQPE